MKMKRAVAVVMVFISFIMNVNVGTALATTVSSGYEVNYEAQGSNQQIVERTYQMYAGNTYFVEMRGGAVQMIHKLVVQEHILS